MHDIIIEITQDGTTIKRYRGFMRIIQRDKQQDVPIDRILGMVISAHDTLLSKNIINAICDAGGTIIYCDAKYMPVSITTPYIGHCHISERIPIQLATSVPLQKNIWRDIIKQKIHNQARTLEQIHPNHKTIKDLDYLTKSVLSGDSKNAESTASRLYFKSLFGKNFLRNRDKQDINMLLNYGYIIIRSAVARHISVTGLLPYVGIKHKNRQNTMPLVDDLMEPFRAVVDYYAYQIWQNKDISESPHLTPQDKRAMADILTVPTETPLGITNINEGIKQYVKSLYDSMANKQCQLMHPAIRYGTK